MLSPNAYPHINRPCLPLDNHLLFYAPLNDNTGALAVSGTGDYIDGVLTNMDPSNWRSEVIGNSLYFDGVDQYIEYGDNRAVKQGFDKKQITIALWVKYVSGINETFIGVSHTTTHISPYYKWLLHRTSSAQVNMRIKTISITTTANLIDIVSGQWTHVTAVYNADDSSPYIDFYKNGVLFEHRPGAYSETIDDSTQNLRIGARHTTTSPYAECFTGNLAEVMVWNRALDAEQIKAVYNQIRNMKA